MRSGPRLGSLLLGAALLLAAPSLLALPKTRLVYVRGAGAEACPESMELRLAVLHRLGYNPFDPNAKESIVLLIRQQDATLQATVELIDDQGLSRGTRLLDAPTQSCDELIAAAALSISLAIDPERALSSREPPKRATERPALTAANPSSPAAQELPPPLLPPTTGDVWPSRPTPTPVVRKRLIPIGVGLDRVAVSRLPAHATVAVSPPPRNRPQAAASAASPPDSNATPSVHAEELPLLPAALPKRAASAPMPVEVQPAAAVESHQASLREQQALLDQARLALGHGQPDRCLAALGTHRSRFPTSLLAEERDALTIKALAASGNLAAAREQATAFLTRYPRSLLLPSIEATVGAIR
jgi:hypothetical protein